MFENRKQINAAGLGRKHTNEILVFIKSSSNYILKLFTFLKFIASFQDNCISIYECIQMQR